MGFVPLKRRPQRAPSPLVPGEGTAARQPSRTGGSGPAPGPGTSQPPDLREIKVCYLNLFSLWDRVRATPRNQDLYQPRSALVHPSQPRTPKSATTLPRPNLRFPTRFLSLQSLHLCLHSQHFPRVFTSQQSVR